jgi:hypothetical protein
MDCDPVDKEVAYCAFDLCTQFGQCELTFTCEPIRSIGYYHTHTLYSAIVEISFTQHGQTTTLVLENTLEHGPIIIPQYFGTTNIIIKSRLHYQQNMLNVNSPMYTSYEYSRLNMKIRGSNIINVNETSLQTIDQTEIFFDIAIE